MSEDFDSIAREIATQDNAATAHPYFIVYNAATAHPYFIVYEGKPKSPLSRWRFKHAFLTRVAAEAYIYGSRHNLREPFVYVESAHDNHEMRSARAAFAESAEVRLAALREAVAAWAAACDDSKAKAAAFMDNRREHKSVPISEIMKLPSHAAMTAAWDVERKAAAVLRDLLWGAK